MTVVVVFILFAIVGLTAAALTGWVIATRGARTRNNLLENDIAAATRLAETAQARLAEGHFREQQRDAELAATRVARDAAETAHHATQRTLEIAGTDLASARAELAALHERLAAKDRGQVREGRAVEEVQRVLAPLMERERLAAQLARLEVGPSRRGELPRLVDAIAEIGAFSTVVLSDEAGLPLAMNRQSTDGEMLAGLWSMLLTVADRIATSGAPVPISVVVHDAANQTILHRLFSTAGSRYLLTAVSRRSLDPGALDPALSKLERVLAMPAQIAS